MPTGGGKSICYQIPALLTDGICIVISPIISLIQDQVSSLKEKNISAEQLHSFLTNSEKEHIIKKCLYSKVKLLYMSPEKFLSQEIQQLLQKITISFFAIDEVHCLSQWGYDFRPSYLNLKVLKKEFPKKNILALTASATEVVLEDIISKLSISNPKILRNSFERKNISYTIEKTDGKFQLLVEKKRSF